MKKSVFIFLLFFIGCQSKNSNGKKIIPKQNFEAKLGNMMNVGQNEMLVATIKTNMGTMKLKLFPKLVPKAVENFVGLILKKYYNGIIFHRIIKGFMIQGGDPTGTGSGGQSLWGGTFNDEFNKNLVFDRAGVLAMANSGPNTNGSQFFITLAPTTWLNQKYTIFGQLISGMDVLKAIGDVKTGKGDRPIQDVTMEDVTVEKKHI